ncbi:MAG TPA: helix-turn-helix domain-containing protein [Acidobacteriota bacterium]|nr:helix-turn-helix domain-containing protein [Acidobacteriota bacterium]HND19125.1 helix-turn-helix domain-containing protein [Acidobacteriota bacterium]
MAFHADNVNFILGLKLKTFRHEKGFSLKDLAEETGLSVSYLSEIEKGKKYPKPEKILHLATALGVQFDELVSMKVDEALDPLKSILDSPFIQSFPFHLFGVQPKELLHLIVDAPEKIRALVHTFLEISHVYDVRVEHFLFAALRSYQQMNGNYFEDLETAAMEFRKAQGWQDQPSVSLTDLEKTLVSTYGYKLDDQKLESIAELRDFRSIWVPGKTPRLLINSRLLPSQKAFIFGREIGYSYLGLEERAATSSWLRVESFEQVLNNFKASYFAGALMMHRDILEQDLNLYFQRDRWNNDALSLMLRRYTVTPEMFFYRLTEVLPKLFGFDDLFFVRFNTNRSDPKKYRLTKVFNMSSVPIPHEAMNEHYCHRWPAIRLLKQMMKSAKPDSADHFEICVERLKFLDDGKEYFNITLARPLALADRDFSSVSICILMNDAFRRKVSFWNDPNIPQVVVNLTCERCNLSSDECQDRVAPPVLYMKTKHQESRERALDQLIREMKGK